MTVFYRFIRPALFDSKRVELATQKNGGICLRFEELDGGLWFTYSICASNQLFSKTVSKNIADARADRMRDEIIVPSLPLTKSSEVLLPLVIDWARNEVDYVRKWSAGMSVIAVCRAEEHLRLADMLELMLAVNASQEQIMQHYKDAIAAASALKVYSHIGKTDFDRELFEDEDEK